MINIFRKHSQTLWIILTIAVIVSFVLFFNGGQGGRMGGLNVGGNTVAVINGQKLQESDIQRDVRRCQLAIAMGLDDLTRGLAGNADSESAAVENFIWNSYVLEHEADRLQIVPSDAEMEAELEKVPKFQTDGQFDGNKLSQFVSDELPSRGFTDSIIDDLLGDAVRLNRIKALVGSTVVVTPSELESRYIDEHQKMDLSVVRLSLSDFENNIKIPDADLQKAFDERKDQFKTEEERQVKTAAFELTEAQKNLKGKDRTDALQKLADNAWNFSQAMLAANANFDALAQKAGATVTLSGTFTSNQPDPVLAKVPSLTPNAFQLTPQYPTSDVLQGENGYYVLHLEQVIPIAPMTFEQAKPQIAQQMKQQQAGEILGTTAGLLRGKLQAGLQNGQSFADAAKAAGLTAETIPPFSLSEAGSSDVPDINQIVQTAVSLSDKELSQYVQTDAGGLFVYMQSREPISKATLALGELTEETTYTDRKQNAAFEEWLRLAREAAHLEIVQQHY